jgi:diguanylate cyclase (GGDEF)-like protein
MEPHDFQESAIIAPIRFHPETVLGVSIILLRLPHGFDYGVAGLLFGALVNLALAPSLSAACVGYAIVIAIPNAVMWLGGVPAFTLVNTNAFLLPWVAFSVLLSYLLDQKNRDAFRYETEYERLAATDLLTGISNRRHLMEMATRELLRARRYRHALSIVILDVDHFKHINDSYGHAVGDDVLRALATTCRHALRSSDVFGRLGGDEFAAVLPNTDLTKAASLAERLRLALLDVRISSAQESFGLTMSVGVATLSPEDADAEGLLKRADAALYQAKNSGRNQVGTARAALQERLPAGAVSRMDVSVVSDCGCAEAPASHAGASTSVKRQ